MYIMLPKENVSEISSASASVKVVGREAAHTYVRTEVLLILTIDRAVY
jgi:hypothetical protein